MVGTPWVCQTQYHFTFISFFPSAFILCVQFYCCPDQEPLWCMMVPSWLKVHIHYQIFHLLGSEPRSSTQCFGSAQWIKENLLTVPVYRVLLWVVVWSWTAWIIFKVSEKCGLRPHSVQEHKVKLFWRKLSLLLNGYHRGISVSASKISLYRHISAGLHKFLM